MTQLDGLRAFAVFAVMWHHWAPANWTFGLPWGSGVQLFFVLSGFLITGILLDNRLYFEDQNSAHWRTGMFRSFYARRFLRIFPIYYIVLFLAAIYGLPHLRETLPWHIFYLTNFSFYFEPGWGTSFGHLWTLAVEEQFYLFWPLLVLTAPMKRLPAIFIVFIAIGPLYRLYGELFSPIGHFYIGTPGSFDSLSLGALMAYGMRFPLRSTSFLFAHEGKIAAACIVILALLVLHILPLPYFTFIYLFLSILFAIIIGARPWGKPAYFDMSLTMPYCATLA